jgi:hypothetical protein
VSGVAGEVTCTLCTSPSIARIALPAGCAAFPDHRVQELCSQHLRSVEPLEPYEVLELRCDPAWFATVS